MLTIALITFQRKHSYVCGLKLTVYVLYMNSENETLISQNSLKTDKSDNLFLRNGKSNVLI